MNTTAYIALGSNIGDGEANLDSAVRAIGQLPGTFVQAVSSFHITKPVGYDNQPDFTNACVRITTDMPPELLMGSLLGIEAAMGRVREGVPKNGPRIIDLDLLLYGDVRMSSPHLTIPHPRMYEREFVLAPLNEILLTEELS